MNDKKRAHVIVGVDGTANSRRAVHFAANTAVTIDADLVIVHAAPGRFPVMPVRPAAAGEYDDFAQSIAHDAAVMARAVQPNVNVSTRVINGPVVHAVVAAAADAVLVVLGSRRERSLAHLWTARILGGVAARTTCPTIVVPPGWEPDVVHGRVLVGFKSAEESADALATAFAEAARRRAELVIVHGWKLPAVYDDIINARVSEEAVRLNAEEMIASAIEPLRTADPTVAVTSQVVHADPVHALVSASREADVLVLTKPGPHHVLAHLGSTARALLRWSECPVVVVPVMAAETVPDDSAARQGVVGPVVESGVPG